MFVRERYLHVFIALFVIIFPGAAIAQMIDVARYLDPRIGKRPVSGYYSISVYADEEVKNQDTDLGLIEQKAGISFPIWQNDRHELALTARGELQDIDSEAVLPENDVPLPGDLWELRFGADYRTRLSNQWMWGISASFGSASDKPFESTDVLDGSAAGFLRIPHRERNAWLFFLYFATNREFLNLIPLPGFGYWYEPNDQFQAVIGIPFLSVTYRPFDGLRLHANYFPARNVHAAVSYQIVPACSVFGEFNWRNERYFRADRTNDDDRLFYYEKNVNGGIRLNFLKHLSLELSGGWAFDRFYFEGEDYDDRDDNRIDVESGPFGKAMVSVRF